MACWSLFENEFFVARRWRRPERVIVALQEAKPRQGVLFRRMMSGKERVVSCALWAVASQ